MIYLKDCAGLTDMGRVRTNNEDAFFIDKEAGLFIVADGMGGHSSGEVASKIVVEALPGLITSWTGTTENFRSEESLNLMKAAIVELSEKVVSETSERPALYGMGATVVIAMLKGNGAVIAHMGDSRVYLHRAGKLKRLTRDHSLVQLLFDAGEITEEQMSNHPAKNHITRHVGMRGEALPDAIFIDLVAGDRSLLCSDGLTGMLIDTAIAKILTDNREPEAACEALVKNANDAGGKDNITVVLADIYDDEASSTVSKYKTRVVKVRKI